MNEHLVVLRRVRDNLLAKTQERSDAGQPQLTPTARTALVQHLLSEVLSAERAERRRRGLIDWSDAEIGEITSMVMSELSGLGPIDLALADPTVEEVVATRFDWWMTYHADGSRRHRPEFGFASDVAMREWLAHLARSMGRTERQFNNQHPLLVMRLGSGLRLAATCEVSQTTTFALRRNTLGAVSVADLIDRNMFPAVIGELLRAMVRAPEARVVIVGATGAGKTTLTRAVLNDLAADTRLVIIEDTAEIDLYDPVRHPNVESWEAREPNSEGEGGVSLGELVKHGLRYRPDLLILGETRDADAATPMLKAMTHGQASLTTVHAESARDGLDKLALLLSTGMESMSIDKARFQLSRAVDFVVHVDRGDGGGRFVSEVLEVAGFEGDQILTNQVFESTGPGEVTVMNRVIARERKMRRGGFDPNLLVGAT